MALRSLHESNMEVLKGGIYVIAYTQMDNLFGKISPKKWANYKIRKAKKQVEKTLSNFPISNK
jgi:hypothetical protein